MAYRPLRRRGAPKLAFLISAIGASFFLSQLAGKLFNRLNNNNFPTYFDQNKHVVHIGGVYITLMQAIIMVSALIMMLFLDPWSRAPSSAAASARVAEDAPTAALMGINIDKTISRTFIIGGALGGAAGFLFGTAFVFSNTMGFIPGVKAFAAAVLGGIGNIRGAMLGGLLLGVVEATGADSTLVQTRVDRHRVDRRGRLPGPGPGAGRPAHRHPRRASGACGMKRRSIEAEARIEQRQAAGWPAWPAASCSP